MYRAVFISDVHIGSSSNISEFLEFLENLETKKLFLVGDIIDIVNSTPNSELERFFYILSNKNWELYYLLGNHEKENPKFYRLKHYFSHIKLYEHFIYQGIKYKVYIEHGDSFHQKDPFNKALKWGLYKFKKALFKNKSKKEQLKRKKGIYYKIKPLIRNVLYKSYVKYIISLAKRHRCDVAVCGHLHYLEKKELQGISYINCGDWLRAKSYVVENSAGEFELKRY